MFPQEARPRTRVRNLPDPHASWGVELTENPRTESQPTTLLVLSEYPPALPSTEVPNALGLTRSLPSRGMVEKGSGDGRSPSSRLDFRARGDSLLSDHLGGSSTDSLT